MSWRDDWLKHIKKGSVTNYEHKRWLITKLDELETQNKQIKKSLEWYNVKKVKKIVQENKQMMEYVQHKEDCIFSKYPFTDVGCSCGLTDLLNKIKG